MRTVPAERSDPVRIRDLYLNGTRLRLRRMTAGAVDVYKLGQKIRTDDSSPELVKITNIYLSAEEYQRLATLTGSRLEKVRWHCQGEAQPFAVDVFGGHLDGLILAEAELPEDGAYLPHPAGAIADVTHVDRFSGGSLANLDSAGARRLLEDVDSWPS